MGENAEINNNLCVLLSAHALDMTKKEASISELSKAISIKKEELASYDNEIHSSMTKISSFNATMRQDAELKDLINEKLEKLNKKSQKLERAALQIQTFHQMFQDKIEEDALALQNILDAEKFLESQIAQSKDYHKQSKETFRANLASLEREEMEVDFKIAAVEKELIAIIQEADERRAKKNELKASNESRRKRMEERKEEMFQELKAKKEAKNKKEDELNQKIAEQDETLTQLKREISRKKLKKEELDRKLTTITNRLVNAKLKIEELDTEHSEIERKIEDLNAEMEAASNQNQLLKEQYVQCESEKEMEIKVINEDFERFKTQNSLAMKEEQNRQKELLSQSSKIREEAQGLETEVQRIRNMKCLVQDKIDSKMMNAASLILTLNNLKEKEKRDEANLSSFKEKEKRLLEENSQMEQTLEKLSKLKIDLRESYEAKEKNKKDIEKSLEKLEFSVGCMLKKLNSKGVELSNKSRLISSVMLKIEECKTNLAEKDELLDGLIKEIDEAERDKRELAHERARLKVQIKDLVKEREESNREKNNLFKLLHTLKEQTDKSLIEMRDAHTVNQRLFGEEIQKFQAADIERDESTERLQNELEKLRRQSKNETGKRLKLAQELKKLKATWEKERCEREGRILKIRQNREVIKSNMKICVEKYQLHQKLITDFLMEDKDNFASDSEPSG